MKKTLIFGLLCLFPLYAAALAGEADVIDVKVKAKGKNTYNFSVTVLHKDTGWKHYANKWEILDQNGKILGTRILHHPHVNEQPFTRSLFGVKIPEGIQAVRVRGHDSVHGYGGKVMSVELP